MIRHAGNPELAPNQKSDVCEHAFAAQETTHPLFAEVFDILVEIAPKLGLDKHDVSTEATTAMKGKFYPAIARKLV